jgi:transmembrane secretion effector
MPDHEQRHETHADGTCVPQAAVSEVGIEWSTWRPLRLPMFRNLLIADLVSDMGTLMQGVGAAWLMVSQGAGPLLALNGIEFNLARAIGPALGGFLIVAAGIGTVFWLNAASYLGVLWVMARWKRPPTQLSSLRENVSGAIRAAVRYTRNAPDILTVLGRIGCIMFFASAFWALLPTR